MKEKKKTDGVWWCCWLIEQPCGGHIKTLDPEIGSVIYLLTDQMVNADEQRRTKGGG